MHDSHASEYYGLPGDGEDTGEKCGEAAERFAENSSLSERLFTRKGKRAFPVCQTIMKMILTERSRRDEEASIGFTLNGVTLKSYEWFKFRDFSAKITSQPSP